MDSWRIEAAAAMRWSALLVVLTIALAAAGTHGYSVHEHVVEVSTALFLSEIYISNANVRH